MANPNQERARSYLKTQGIEIPNGMQGKKTEPQEKSKKEEAVPRKTLFEEVLEMQLVRQLAVGQPANAAAGATTVPAQPNMGIDPMMLMILMNKRHESYAESQSESQPVEALNFDSGSKTGSDSEASNEDYGAMTVPPSAENINIITINMAGKGRKDT